jgi:hypothetical protein
MQIETGKCYRTLGGRKVGPAFRATLACSSKYPWDLSGSTYTDSGIWNMTAMGSSLDLAAEWPADRKIVDTYLPGTVVHVRATVESNGWFRIEDDWQAAVVHVESQPLKVGDRMYISGAPQTHYLILALFSTYAWVSCENGAPGTIDADRMLRVKE